MRDFRGGSGCINMYPVLLLRGGSGFFIDTIVGGESIEPKKLVYIDSDGKWRLCDSDIITKLPTTGITLDTVKNGLTGRVLVGWGFVGDESWNFTRGKKVYASGTPGELTQNVPDVPGAYFQMVGIAQAPKLIEFIPRMVRGYTELTELYTENIPVDELGKPGIGTPTEDDFDNVTAYAFTVDTDFLTLKLSIPTRYASGGIKLSAVWTNDGGVDNNGQNIKVEFSYQTGKDGDQISGNHANSPKTVEDTYTSDLGRVEHLSEYVTIAEDDFIDKLCIFTKISFITAPAVVLDCEPRLIGVCLQYRRYII